jgi:hypothetical protein
MGSDYREIIFRNPCPIDGRKPGVVYSVTSDLAHHYVAVTGVADYKSDGREDRAMRSNPTGDQRKPKIATTKKGS